MQGGDIVQQALVEISCKKLVWQIEGDEKEWKWRDLLLFGGMMHLNGQQESGKGTIIFYQDVLRRRGLFL
jgi:hypothetical protein